MYKLKLTKGLSYSVNGIKVTKAHPEVTVDDKNTADYLISTGSFALIASEVADDDDNKPEEINLKKMSKDELIAFADSKGISLEGCTNNEMRIAAIQKALEASEVADDDDDYTLDI